MDADRELTGPTLALVVAEAVRACFMRLDGNRYAMARELGVSRSTVQRYLRDLGLRPAAPAQLVAVQAPPSARSRWKYAARRRARRVDADRLVPGRSAR